MSANSRLTVAFHLMTWLANKQLNNIEWIPSEQMATSVNTNAVFIRRILSLLKKAKLVLVQHGGNHAGWKLARKASDILLLEVFEAVESKPLFDMHHSILNPACHIAQGIQPALQDVYIDVENSIKRELSQKTVADLLNRTLNGR
ncbi:Rrf2 family transcriptional regulator [Paenibacillus sp. CGMCC 1.16610]|uniref:Transcriptional regulator n=1 Tax=Paenibacillus anseongense TaxID=2682845 RepID=A0ABW9UH53_9BACL|nr:MULTISPECIES: Rrf2 family transcriptional regulator [Paenibacillus]MBA2939854.1 Rrf2 family transcriptional regulator [Paenibacillus sp. CGMCC 1.16610]MVQ39514.1 transcriptional regulator [Paenibacillus anseongense]